MDVVRNTVALSLKAKLFRGFSDPSRLSILEALKEQPLNVTDLVHATGMSQSNVSNHLGCLRDCDLVIREHRGRFTYYRLADERLIQLLERILKIQLGRIGSNQQPKRPNRMQEIVHRKETLYK